MLTDVIEKHVSSSYISTGLYGFSSADLFIKAYDALKESLYKDRIPIYVSHIISYLLGVYQVKFACYETREY